MAEYGSINPDEGMAIVREISAFLRELRAFQDGLHADDKCELLTLMERKAALFERMARYEATRLYPDPSYAATAAKARHQADELRAEIPSEPSRRSQRR